MMPRAAAAPPPGRFRAGRADHWLVGAAARTPRQPTGGTVVADDEAKVRFEELGTDTE
jgi:hypothetical protein